MNDPFHFACPTCHYHLTKLSSDLYVCMFCHTSYPRTNGIWEFLPPELKQEYQQFMQEYQAVRTAEGRGSQDPAYYRELPFHDLTGKFARDWKIRARSFRRLLDTIIIPMERKTNRKLKILDLGAGNGWLSYRLAQRGHILAAVDLQTDPLDGLGAHHHYDQPFVPVQADYNHLPFSNNQADAVIFNASFHYSTNYEASLIEALRILRAEGQVVILDSPIYHDTHSGVEMVREREEHFQESYGFASNALPSENYLTYQRLDELSQGTGLQWRMVNVFYGLAWVARPVRARLKGRREPAQFRIAAGQRQ
jgi:SAM-dependent methyltransferase